MPRSRHRRQLRRRASKHAALHALRAEVDDVLRTWIPAAPEGMPPVLFHYTSWGGFSGIVQRQRIHARIHNRTNDTAELQAIDAIAVEVVKQVADSMPGSLVRQVVDAFVEHYDGQRISQQAKVYLACFSVAEDDPTQWARYGCERDPLRPGAGVRLGIRTLYKERLSQRAREPYQQTLPVIYDDGPIWRPAFDEHFRQVFACYERFAQAPHDDRDATAGANRVVAALMTIAAIASFRAKTPAPWSAEREWRSVALDWEGRLPTKLKADGAPYVEFRLRDRDGDLCEFSEILLGPRQELPADEAIAAARRVLVASGYDSQALPPIRVSTVDLPTP
jgi:hypothetical protein